MSRDRHHRIGSLCSGAGGLDLAVEAAFGGTTVWHCETDPVAARVLAHRWPGVPNLGDLTQIDWNELLSRKPDLATSTGCNGSSHKCEGGDAQPSLAVDILTAGYP